MYFRYAEDMGWKVEVMNTSHANAGGYKEITFSIKGKDAYGRMKFESGVHRVQRIPETESQGRVHTSTATCAVLPEAEEIDVKINESDLRYDIFRSSGPGGQSVNTTDSAVRLTHVPSGITVSMQDEKSQLKNKTKALSVMRTRLYALEREQQMKERGDARSSQIGTGERSEKIRTYNFPQDRVTDHRIKQNFSNLPGILEGAIGPIIDELTMEEQARLMSGE
jgi:peptide chain release factor 1